MCADVIWLILVGLVGQMVVGSVGGLLGGSFWRFFSMDWGEG